MQPELVPPTHVDGVLLRRYAARHDADAVAELVKRYGGLVFSTARRITGNDHDAEDVAQQCFLELARRAGTFSGPVIGWLYQLACNRSLNFRRDSATRRAYEAKIPPRKPELPAEPTWAELEPLIDEAIASVRFELDEEDVAYIEELYVLREVSY